MLKMNRKCRLSAKIYLYKQEKNSDVHILRTDVRNRNKWAESGQKILKCQLGAKIVHPTRKQKLSHFHILSIDDEENEIKLFDPSEKL